MSELQPHQQRVVQEKQELDERLSKLHSFLGSQVFNSLDADEQSRLRRQADLMNQLSIVLGERIAKF